MSLIKTFKPPVYLFLEEDYASIQDYLVPNIDELRHESRHDLAMHMSQSKKPQLVAGAGVPLASLFLVVNNGFLPQNWKISQRAFSIPFSRKA